MHHFSPLLALLWAVDAANAFFVIDCGVIVREAVDPIVNFNSDGLNSNHIHAIAGGDAWTGDLTYEKTQESTCTSCPVPEDLSNYWAPDLYFHHKTKGFIATAPPSFVICEYFEGR